MLVAQKENGERFSLAGKKNRDAVERLRQTESFVCPECGGKVRMKLGDMKIWHFSHVKEDGCPSRHDPESRYHLEGKLQLYQWLQRLGMDPELEKLEPNTRQKADAAVDRGGRQYALEYQCSSISSEIFQKRTDGYLDNGWTPVWVLGGSQIRRTAAKTVALNEFHYLFLRPNCGGWMLPAYCPDSRQFIILTNIHPITTSKALCSFMFTQTTKADWGILFEPQDMNFVPDWNKELEGIKQGLLRNPRAIRSGFHQELYLNRLNLMLLPPEIGIPVHSSPFIRTSPLIWQTYLFLDLFRHFSKGKLVNDSIMAQAFQNRIRKGDVKTRHLPLARRGSHLDALKEYASFLVRCHYFEPAGTGLYRTLRKMEPSASFEDQAKRSLEFYRMYLQKMF